jgi:ketosteroid isomerase-like protein
MILRTWLIAAASSLLLFAGPSFAQDDPASVEQVARAYLAAYESADIEQLARLAAEDIEFRDDSAPTGPGGGPYHFVGRDAWLAGLRGFVTDGGLIDLRQTHDLAWQSGSQMVFVGTVDARYRDPAGGVFHFKTRIVTVLTVRNGLVWRHIDVADYSGARTEVVRDEAPDKQVAL